MLWALSSTGTQTACTAHSIMKEYSRFVVVVDNLSSSTPTKDIEYEFGYAGRIRDIARDYKARCALVEYESLAPELPS